MFGVDSISSSCGYSRSQKDSRKPLSVKDLALGDIMGFYRDGKCKSDSYNICKGCVPVNDKQTRNVLIFAPVAAF